MISQNEQRNVRWQFRLVLKISKSSLFAKLSKSGGALIPSNPSQQQSAGRTAPTTQLFSDGKILTKTNSRPNPPKLPDDKTFIKHPDTMASAKPLWGRQRGPWLVEPVSARTSGEPMGSKLEAWKWLLQGKGPHQRQLGFGDGGEGVMEGVSGWKGCVMVNLL